MSPQQAAKAVADLYRESLRVRATRQASLRLEAALL
jgi:hypothetical protein